MFGAGPARKLYVRRTLVYKKLVKTVVRKIAYIRGERIKTLFRGVCGVCFAKKRVIPNIPSFFFFFQNGQKKYVCPKGYPNTWGRGS